MFCHYHYYIVISLKSSKVILQDENLIGIFSMQDYATPMCFQDNQHQFRPSTSLYTAQCPELPIYPTTYTSLAQDDGFHQG